MSVRFRLLSKRVLKPVARLYLGDSVLASGRATLPQATKETAMRAWGLVLLLGLAGCVTTSETGRAYDTNAVAQLKIGVTTEVQARDIFGTPASVTREADGNTVLMYMHVTTQSRGLRSHGNGDVLLLRFGADGRLLKYRDTQTPTGTNLR